MLSWQPSPQDPEVFHITHVDNLPSIVAGGLVCDARVAAGAVTPTTIGSSSIKQRRLHWKLALPDRPTVGSFVPFYFCPRSVMLYSIHRGHPNWAGGDGLVVHLVSRVSRLVTLGQRCVFTDGNAATSYHTASEDLRDLPTMVDWSVMPLTQWSDAAKKGPRQAEFLVDAHVPWSAIEQIVVRDQNASLAVQSALRGAPAPGIDVRRTWYYS
jgi:hypothetical protein